MKLILITDSASVDGGVSKVAIDSALACAKRGIAVHYIAACGPVAAELQDVPNLQVTCLGQFDLKNDPRRARAAINGIFNFPLARSLQSIFAAADPAETVVHFHGWSKAVSPLPIRVAAKSKLSTILTIHEYFIACPNGGFYVHKDDAICHRTPLSLDCLLCNCDSRSYSHKLWRYSRTFLQKYALQIPALIKNYILLSPVSRRAVEPYLPRDARIHMLDNPIDVTDRGRTPVEDNQIFLFVGRFSREKGVLRLAEAVRDLGVPAVFIGDGHLRADMERIAPKATFTGWLKAEEIAAWMRRARALVFPSTWYEGQPLVPIEAAASGLPCVLSNCNAAVDYLLDGERAIHFQYDSLEALKAKMLSLQDNELVGRLSRNVYQWYWQNPWSIDRHADQLIEIYHSLLGKDTGLAPADETRPGLAQALA
jgi:glycosyltransferase involved in cell wall biosynthesis